MVGIQTWGSDGIVDVVVKEMIFFFSSKHENDTFTKQFRKSYHRALNFHRTFPSSNETLPFSLLIFCRQDTFSTPLPFFSQTTELHLLTLETTGRRRRSCLLGSKKKTLPKTPKRNFTINTFYSSRLASENEIFLPFNAPGRRIIFPFLSSSQLLPPLKTINFHLLFPLVRQPMRRMATSFVGSGLLAAGFAIDWGLTKAQEMSRTD